MPFINVKLIDGVFSPAQKQQIAKTLTDAMVADERRLTGTISLNDGFQATRSANRLSSRDPKGDTDTQRRLIHVPVTHGVDKFATR